MKKINVLFVCLGSICRSPMAEFIFKHKVQQAGLKQYISVDSAAQQDGIVEKVCIVVLLIC